MSSYQYNCDIGFSPFPAVGDTDYTPILELWSEVGSHVRNLSLPESVSLTLDVSDVLEVLRVGKMCDDGADKGVTRPLMMRWVEQGYMARLGLRIESESELDPGEISRFVHSAVQHLFLAQSLCAQGAGHFNGARIIGQTGSKLDDQNIAYYGDSIEFAWYEAGEWGYPGLVNLGFSEVWEWLMKSDFHSCSVARSPLHKVFATLLTISHLPSRAATADIFALSQAFESLLGGSSERIGSSLKARVNLILGEPATHKRWITDFYGLRSRIVHGAFPIVRPGAFPSENDLYQHEMELMKPIDRVTAVLLCLLQRLIVTGSTGFAFSETFRYQS